MTWLEGRCLSYGGLPAWPFMEILLGWLGAEIGEPKIAIRTKARAGLGAAARRRRRSTFSSARPACCDSASRPTARPTARRRRTRTSGGSSGTRRRSPWWSCSRTSSGPTRRPASSRRRARADRSGPVALVLSRGAGYRLGGCRLRIARARRLRPSDDGDRSSSRRRRRGREELLSVSLPTGWTRRRAPLLREAEGNPLYLEELARALVEGALEPRGRTWTMTVSALELMPPALENLLVARIDRLPRMLAGSPRSRQRSGGLSRWPSSRLSRARRRARRSTRFSGGDRARAAAVPGVRVLVHARSAARRRALDAHVGTQANALRGDRPPSSRSTRTHSKSTTSGSPTTTPRQETSRRRSSMPTRARAASS